ncbi:MAG: GNAT family N-acetyltransferase [Pseudomonadota bacterium]
MDDANCTNDPARDPRADAEASATGADADGNEIAIRVVQSIDEVPAEDWDACAVPDPATANPFVRHAFLKALEDARTVTSRTGWMPHHLMLTEGERVIGCAPAYLKSHSQGEYIFDYGWADAYERAGGRYYPKLQVAVPFTPVPGPRLLVRPGPEADDHRAFLGAGIAEIAKRNGLSSSHITFLSEREWRLLSGQGYLQRVDQQFHWLNDGYATFDDFLAALSSRKRKSIRKERREAVQAGLDIVWLRGADITEADWDAFYEFYQDTGSRKWGRPYLNRPFFTALHEAMPDDCLLVLARRDGKAVAGALNLIGGDCLYGRYWGAVEHHPCLHFEICYYQAIDFAIEHGLARVEAGAQGEHKLARGYMPMPTYSAHWICDTGFREAVSDYLEREREHADYAREALAAYAPFKKSND